MPDSPKGRPFLGTALPSGSIFPGLCGRMRYSAFLIRGLSIFPGLCVRRPDPSYALGLERILPGLYGRLRRRKRLMLYFLKLQGNNRQKAPGAESIGGKYGETPCTFTVR